MTTIRKGNIEAEVILATSNAYVDLPPIYTFRIRFPRFVAEQFLKHRAFSCNAVSSRAMSVPKMNQWIESGPAMPVFWGAQKKGMQPTEAHTQLVTKEDGVYGFIDMDGGVSADQVWCDAMQYNMQIADALWDAGYHQQIPNRLTHAFQMAEYIVTGTNFENFFNLRLHDKAAQSEIAILAQCMKIAMDTCTIQEPLLIGGERWHLPYTTIDERFELPLESLCTLSAARAAIVSYNNHDTDELLPVEKAAKIYDHLVNDTNPHLTPMEHSARCLSRQEYIDACRVQAHMCKFADVGNTKPLERRIVSTLTFANLYGWQSQRYLFETCQL